MRARAAQAAARRDLAGLRGKERLQCADRVDQAGAVLLALRLGGECGRRLHQDRAHLVRRDGRLALDEERDDAGRVHHAAGADHDAVGVDQEDAAVRRQRAVDLGRPLAPVTRLSAIEPALGWMNWVFSPAPMLNVYQLMIALWLDCVTVRVVPCCWICTVPPATTPPSGLAKAPGGSAISAAAR